jgi:predicted TIM-barrel fold metal-dependent hydrolase
MAKGGFMVFDSDMHCVEPPDLWARYIADEFKARAPRSHEIAFRCVLPYFLVDGRIMPTMFKTIPAGLTVEMIEQAMLQSPQVDIVKRKQEIKYKYFSERDWSSRSHLDAMDEEGVDLTVVFPTSGLLSMAIDDLEPRFAAAIASAYNDWLYDYCQADPTRLFGAAMISAHDVDNAVAEVERAVTKLGFRGVFLPPNLIAGRPWYDPYYESLWSAIEAHDVPLCFHEAIGTALPQVGDCFGTNVYLRHVACHPMEMMLGVLNMCGGGVLERHPKLRVAFLEGNAGWVPWLLDRMDDHYEMNFGISPDVLPHKPSTYFHRQCYISVETDEETVADVINRIGERSLLLSTDWPHPDSKYPRAIQTFLDKPELSDDTKRRILWDNSARLYGFSQPSAAARVPVEVASARTSPM